MLEHQNHVKGLLKCRLLGPPPEILMQQVKGGAWEVAFLSNSRWCLHCQFKDHTLRITGLDHSHNSKSLSIPLVFSRSFFRSNHPARIFPFTTETSVHSDNVLQPLGTFSINFTWRPPWGRIASLCQALREDCGNSNQTCRLYFSPAIRPVSIFKPVD